LDRRKNKLLRKWFPDLKPRDVNLYFRSSIGDDERLAGVEWWSRRDDVPPGWRYVRKDGMIVPHRSSREGKVIAAEFDTVVISDPRRQVPGMPRVFFGALPRVLGPGYERLEDGRAVYCRWGIAPVPDQLAARIDRSIWKPVALSKFYKVKEAANPALVPA
jgi:hypothetical protein